MPIQEVKPLDPDVLRKAATIASGELVTRARFTLQKLDLAPEAGPIAAAGAVFVADVGNWAAQHGLMSVETAVMIQSIALEAVEALQALGLPDS